MDGKARHILGWVLLLWFALIIANGVVRPPEFHQVYPSLVRLLRQGGILWQLPDGFAANLFKTLTFFGFCFLPGWFLVRILRMRVPMPLRLCLSFIVGWGVLCLPLEILAIFHQLHRWPILLVCAMVLLLAWLIHRRIPDRHLPVSDLKPDMDELSKVDRGFWWLSMAMISLITLLSFYHALLYPVTYWDSLILYIHYGEMTFLEGGFPVRVCAQVGLGLGANYPHFYPLTSATIATIWGQWSDIYGQFFPPFAGLLSTVFIYFLLKEVFASRLAAALGTLIFRSLAYPLCYYIWASDYAIVMMLSSAILWLCFRALKSHEQIYLAAAALLTGFAWHINYLGGIFLAPILASCFFFPRDRRLKIGATAVLVAGGFAFSWYLRNIIVTGNPVYAFFPNIFGGKHIDMDVLASCSQEWTSNGDGVARLGSTLWEKLLRTPGAFLFATNWHWKFGPALFGLAIPGVAIMVVRLFRKTRGALTPFSIVALILLAAGLFYEYVISGLYLYHILFLVPVIVYASSVSIDFIRGVKGTKTLLCILLIIAGLLPGLALALSGPKLMSFGLTAFKYPGLEREQFWRIRFPEDSRMWEFINRELTENAGIITHENRYHVFRRDLRVYHQDDWDFSRLYGHAFADVRALMEEKGIGYYLYIPNEENHPITQQLGIGEHLDSDFNLIYSSGKSKLYRLLK